MCVCGGGGGWGGVVAFGRPLLFFLGGGSLLSGGRLGSRYFWEALLYSRTFFTEQMIFFTDHSTQSKFLLTRYVKTGCIRVSVEIPWRQ